MLRYNNAIQCIHLEGIKFATKTLITFLQMIKSNTTLRMMGVNDGLFFNKQIKEQLELFNKNRRNQLMLNARQISYFGDTLTSLACIIVIMTL